MLDPGTGLVRHGDETLADSQGPKALRRSLLFYALRAQRGVPPLGSPSEIQSSEGQSSEEWGDDHPEAEVEVAVGRGVPEAEGAAGEVWNAAEGAAAQHPGV
jgi:hypothetical protein